MSVTLVIPHQLLHIAETEVDARRLAAARGVPAAAIAAGHVVAGADRHGNQDAWEAEPDRIRLHVNEWQTMQIFTAAQLREELDDIARIYFGSRQ